MNNQPKFKFGDTLYCVITRYVQGLTVEKLTVFRVELNDQNRYVYNGEYFEEDCVLTLQEIDKVLERHIEEFYGESKEEKPS